jgi:tetratricopeptide (TPR) repeat protein
MGTRTLDGMLTLSYAHMLRGRLFLEQGLPAEAYAEFEQAAAIRGALLEDDPENLSLKKVVAITGTCLGGAARELGRFEEASRHYYAAYEMHKRLHGLQPDVVEQAIRASRSLINCAVAHMDCKTEADDSQASVLLNEAEGWLERLRASGKLLGWERNYEVCLSAIQQNREIIRHRAEQRMSEEDHSSRQDAD